MPAGRPSTYEQTIADEICERIAAGESLRRICGSKEEMPAPSTVIEWVLRRPDFAEQYARAREIQAQLLSDEIFDIAEEEPTAVITFGEDGHKECVDAAGIQRNRLRVDTRKWYLSKVLPKVYGDKLETVHSGEVSFVSKSILEE
jgi:hypothetical protein